MLSKCFRYNFRNYYTLYKFKRIVGSGKEGVEETIDKSGWNLEQRKFYSDDFKQKVFFLLLYFKRKNMIMPKPFILILSIHLKKIS